MNCQINQRNEERNIIRCFEVTDPQLHSKGFTIYKVICKIMTGDSVDSPVSQTICWKRYNDFKKLYKATYSRHHALHQRDQFPPFAQSKVFGRFDKDVVIERQQSAQDLLNFISCRSHLVNSVAFKKFISGCKTLPLENPVKFNQTENIQQNNVLKEALLQPETSQCKYYEDLSENVVFYQDNESDDDVQTDFTDDSNLSTPMLDTDFSFFDPLSKVKIRKTSDVSGVDSDLKSISISNELNKEKNFVTKSNFVSLENNNFTTFNSTKIQKVSSAPQSLSDMLSQSDKNKTSRSVVNSPTRSALNKISSLITLDVKDRGEYIYKAAEQITIAQENEAQGNYAVAFQVYKNGIELLLKGVQDDDDDNRIEVVRRKTGKYLKRAEEIYSRYLSPSKSDVDENQRWESLENNHSPPDVINCQMDKSVLFLKGNMQEFEAFNVVQIIYRLVMVVSDSKSTYVIKALRKSSLGNEKKTIAPTHCPFMVQLYKFYETETNIYLLLEHVSGGRLWKYISDYLNKNISNQDNFTPDIYQVPFNFNCNDSQNISFTNGPQIIERQISNNYDTENNSNNINILPNDKFKSNFVCNNIKKTENNIKKIGNADSKLPLIAEKKENITKSQDISKTKKRHLSTVFSELDLANEISFENRRYIPESCIQRWAAEIVVALSTLHSYGVLCRDLRPSNLLISEGGHILLTYFSQWNCIDQPINSYASHNLYAAPEIGTIRQPTFSCDWWSLGVLLYEIVTGHPLSFYFPSGFNSHSQLVFSNDVSNQIISLIRQLICYEPGERLNELEIKQHPFFESIDWESLEK